MISTITNIPIKIGVLLVGLGLLVAGCDSAGPSADTKLSDGDALIQVTNDLGDRMTTFGDSETNAILPSGVKASPKFTLRTRAQIEPPTTSQSASHLHLDRTNSQVYVGYKVTGPTFGGGVDILDANNPTNLGLGDQSLRTQDLDVQEVVFDGNDNIYMAGAVDFGNIPARDFGNTPATIIRAKVNASSGSVSFPGSGGGSGSTVSATEVAMPNRLVKGVGLPSPVSSASSDIYAITDSSVVFGFDSDLGSRVSRDVSPNTEELRSISTYHVSSAPRLLALGTNGDIYKFSTGSGINLDNVRSYPAVGDGTLGNPSDLGISRLETTRIQSIAGSLGLGSEENLHFIGLNEGNGDGGIRVLSEGGREIRYGTNFQAYVTVTAAVDNGELKVFAGSPGGTIDVFKGTDGLACTEANQSASPACDNINSVSEALQSGLELQGSFDISGLTGDVNVDEAQINQIEYWNTGSNEYLFVATSTEGVVVLELDRDASDIF